MSEENMKQYRAEKKLDTWWVVEWPDNAVASFMDSKTSTAEASAKEYADKMNAAYANRNRNKCIDTIGAACYETEYLLYWMKILFNKLHRPKNTDTAPDYTATEILGMLHESLERTEKAVNSIPPAEDVEKAIKKHKN